MRTSLKVMLSKSEVLTLRKFWSVLFLTYIFILLLISFSLNWIAANFNGVGFDEILFHLRMPINGAGSYVKSYIFKVLLPAAGILAEILIAILFIKVFLDMKPALRDKLKKVFSPFVAHRILIGSLIIIIWFSAASYRAQNWFGLFDYLRSSIQHSSFFDQEYVDPGSVSISFPEKKRNLIYIFMESAESSSQDKQNGGLLETNLIPEMTEIAKENVSFSQSGLIEGAAVAPLCGWTMAGVFCESTGLPLKSYSVIKDSEKKFMPGVTALGDILEKEGYTNIFMCGSEAEFGGREKYFLDHGDYRILDYNESLMEGRIPDDYKVSWGFEDQKLYEWAKDELLELSVSGQPFNLTMLTVDTHAQDGYVCDLCGNDYTDQYKNVWSCASRQVDEFISWCQKQDFYENTTIVIAGDHCSMQTDFYEGYDFKMDTGEHERKVYNAFINPDAEVINSGAETNRLFTTLDLFPSTLAALGCKIEGNRLGLGTNLFSGEKTLSEQYGYDYLFQEIRKQSATYNKLMLVDE